MKKRNRMGSRFLSFILIVSVLFTMQGFPILAETVDFGNVTEVSVEQPDTEKSEDLVSEISNLPEPAQEQEIGGSETAETEGSGLDGTEEPSRISEMEQETEGSGVSKPEDNPAIEDTQALLLEESEKEVYAAGAGQPSNPVHHCTKKNDGSDYTDWSYVYFGSYPQTEVTGSDLTSAIIGADYDGNGDAWVDGTKYRRISKSDANNDYYFGSNTYRYFKWERIKWKVLQNNGSTLFVVADKGLDCKDYNEEYKSITWENCTLRNWLNGIFYNTAFSNAEQAAVEGRNNISDKVYLLSIGEVTDQSYGFCEGYGTYSVSRRVKISDYTHAMGASSSFDTYQGNSDWWLRSSGGEMALIVYYYGYVDSYGVHNVDYSSDAVVPALHIDLSSNLWSSTDDGTSGEGGNGEDGGSTDVGNAKVSCIEQKEIRTGKEDFLFLSIHADKESELDAVKNVAEITVSDTSVFSAEKGSLSKGLAPTSAGATDAIWTLKLKGLKPGNAKIEIKLKGNIAASCDVTVTTSTGKSPIPVDSNDPAQVSKAVAFKLSDYMSDIEGENATIYGPTLDIIGKQFSLFQIDASTKIGTDNLKAEVSYDVEKKLVKVLVGVSTSGKAGIDGTTDNRMCNASWSEEYNQFKSLYKQMTGLEAKKSNGNGTYWNQFQKLKGKMNRFQCKLMVDANMWASGYMEWSYESGELKFSEGGFVEQATLEVGFKQYVPQAPLVYWFINVTADEKGNFLFKKAGDALAADFSLTPSLAAEIGVGAGKSEGKYQTYLEASMEAILAANIANKDPKLTVNLTGNLHARAYALGYEFVDETLPFANVQLYPGENSRAFRTRTVAIGDVNDPYKDAKPLARDYLAEPETAPAALSMANAYLYEQNNIYPYCEPHLFALSGRTFSPSLCGR